MAKCSAQFWGVTSVICGSLSAALATTAYFLRDTNLCEKPSADEGGGPEDAEICGPAYLALATTFSAFSAVLGTSSLIFCSLAIKMQRTAAPDSEKQPLLGANDNAKLVPNTEEDGPFVDTTPRNNERRQELTPNL